MIEDLSVFFDAEDFVVPAVRQRVAVADLPVAVIAGMADQEALQGHVMAAQFEARFAAADVLQGDSLVFASDVTAGCTVVIPAGEYRVLRVDRDNDGAEMCAWLGTP